MKSYDDIEDVNVEIGSYKEPVIIPIPPVVEPVGYWYNVQVYIPDDNGGSTTEFSRFAADEDSAMESVREDNPDVTVVYAFLQGNQ